MTQNKRALKHPHVPDPVHALANQPVLIGLLREARAALAAEFCGTTDSLAGRIDGVIHQVAP